MQNGSSSMNIGVPNFVVLIQSIGTLCSSSVDSSLGGGILKLGLDSCQGLKVELLSMNFYFCKFDLRL